MEAPSSVFSRFRLYVRLVCLPWFCFSSLPWFFLFVFLVPLSRSLFPSGPLCFLEFPLFFFLSPSCICLFPFVFQVLSPVFPPVCMAFPWLFIEPENAMRSPLNNEASDRCYCRSNGDRGASVSGQFVRRATSVVNSFFERCLLSRYFLSSISTSIFYHNSAIAR